MLNFQIYFFSFDEFKKLCNQYTKKQFPFIIDMYTGVYILVKDIPWENSPLNSN